MLELRSGNQSSKNRPWWDATHNVHGAVKRFGMNSILRIQARQLGHQITDDFNQPAFAISRRTPHSIDGFQIFRPDDEQFVIARTDGSLEIGKGQPSIY